MIMNYFHFTIPPKFAIACVCMCRRDPPLLRSDRKDLTGLPRFAIACRLCTHITRSFLRAPSEGLTRRKFLTAARLAWQSGKRQSSAGLLCLTLRRRICTQSTKTESHQASSSTQCVHTTHSLSQISNSSLKPTVILCISG